MKYKTIKINHLRFNKYKKNKIMYKSTKEIQDIFSIDITEKNRTIPFVALRCFYAEMRVEQLKDAPKAFDIIAKEINCNRPNLYNILLKAKLFKEDKHTKILFEAFKTKDKALIDEYNKQVKELTQLKRNQMYLDRTTRTHISATRVVKLTKADKNKDPMSNLKLAEFLRTNKVIKHDLWDTPVRNISPNQWQQVRSINEKMYDNFVNN